VREWLLTFALMLAAGMLAFSLPSFGTHLPLLILPSGVAVAMTYRWGPRMWLAVFAATIATNLWAHRPLLTAICIGIGAATGAVLAAWILVRRGFDPNFSRGKDVPLFILAAATGLTVTPTFGLLGVYLANPVPGAARPAEWFTWWSNVTAAALVLGPMLVAVHRHSLAQFTERWTYGVLWLAGVALCCASMFVVDGQYFRAPILIFALFLVVVGVIRFGLVTASFGSFVIITVLAYGIAYNHGALQGLNELQGLVLSWSVSVTQTGITLVITALLAERDSAGMQRLRAERRYAQVFDGSPQPIWVHDRDSLQILMVNQAAVRQYGWSRDEMLSMSAAALIAPGESQEPPDPACEHARTEPFEARHLTRDGRLLDVEVWMRSIDFGDQPAELVFAADVTERRAFGRALVDAIAGEQRRIGQEMHDGLGQELTGLALSVRALANRAERERDAIADELDQLASIATSCIQDARLIVQGLSPLTDADGSLEAALEALARRSSLSGTQVSFRLQHEAPLDIDLKTRNHLYRIAQEAVQNALKHSGAKAVEITFYVRNGSVRLEILDDGRGLPDVGSRGAGLGMRTMRFRSSAIGGRLFMGRRGGGGNSVVCEAPQARQAQSTPAPERAPL
jgi:PAS domain S-box-containing protein